MKCTVIDDEPFALELIKDYINKTPFLELGECFTNPFKALAYLTDQHTDLVFLDINMPELTGIQLLKSIPVFSPQKLYSQLHILNMVQKVMNTMLWITFTTNQI